MTPRKKLCINEKLDDFFAASTKKPRRMSDIYHVDDSDLDS